MKTEIKRQMDEIIAILGRNPEGLARGQISGKLNFTINYKTLQRRLTALVEQSRITKEGEKKATRYFPAHVILETTKGHIRDNLERTKGYLRDNNVKIFSLASRKTLEFLKIPLHSREKVSYNRDFLDNYVPNQTVYVPKKNKKRPISARETL